MLEIDGWEIRIANLVGKTGARSLCCNSVVKKFHIYQKKNKVLPMFWGNGSISWKNVTCKNCLKMKK